MEYDGNESQSNTLSGGICRCCLSEICNSLQSEDSSGIQSEHYLDLLNDTFGIQMTFLHKSRTSNMICEKCAVQICSARDFKKQVLNAESALHKYLQGPKMESDSSPPPESPPASPPAPDPDDLPLKQLQLIATKGKDDMIAEVKSEAEDAATSHGDKPADGGGAEGTFSLIKSDRPARDWAKIAERRGAGPLRRHNSLALLRHSSACVFQWHRSRYRCFCCQQPFTHTDSLIEHTTQHTLGEIERKIIQQQNRLVKVEITSLLCKICDAPLSTIESLIAHLTQHDITFRGGSGNLLVPFKLHDGPLLECQLCAEKFAKFRLLNIHMNRHYRNHVCHVCGAAFSNLVFLNLHKSRAHRPVACAICGADFTERRERRAHERSAHGVKHERKLRFPCTYCDERFYQENLRVQHMVDRHGLARPQHRCTLCPKVFITRSLCNSHIKHVHMKQRNRECDVCHMRFYSVSDVNRHKVTHTGEKNFSCGACGSVFATRDSLRRHGKRAHAGN